MSYIKLLSDTDCCHDSRPPDKVTREFLPDLIWLVGGKGIERNESEKFKIVYIQHVNRFSYGSYLDTFFLLFYCVPSPQWPDLSHWIVSRLTDVCLKRMSWCSSLILLDSASHKRSEGQALDPSLYNTRTYEWTRIKKQSIGIPTLNDRTHISVTVSSYYLKARLIHE